MNSKGSGLKNNTLLFILFALVLFFSVEKVSKPGGKAWRPSSLYAESLYRAQSDADDSHSLDYTPVFLFTTEGGYKALSFRVFKSNPGDGAQAGKILRSVLSDCIQSNAP